MTTPLIIVDGRSERRRRVTVTCDTHGEVGINTTVAYGLAHAVHHGRVCPLPIVIVERSSTSRHVEAWLAESSFVAKKRDLQSALEAVRAHLEAAV